MKELNLTLGDGAEELTIKIDKPLPKEMRISEVCEQQNQCEIEAQALFYSLSTSLPGGVFDRLLLLMLRDKLSYLLKPWGLVLDAVQHLESQNKETK